MTTQFYYFVAVIHNYDLNIIVYSAEKIKATLTNVFTLIIRRLPVMYTIDAIMLDPLLKSCEINKYQSLFPLNFIEKFVKKYRNVLYILQN